MKAPVYQISEQFEKSDFPDSISRILAVTIGGLGDAILFSPVLKGLRNAYPDSNIELLIASKLANQVYGLCIETNSTHTLGINNRFILSKVLELLRFSIRARSKGGYDIGVFATGLNPKLVPLIKYLAKIKKVLVAPKYPYHKTDLNCNVMLSRIFDRSITEKDTIFPFSSQISHEADRVIKGYGISVEGKEIISIYPSTKLWIRPRWELTKLVNVVYRLKQDKPSRYFVLIGSELEGKQWGKIDNNNIVDANLAGKLSIFESAFILKKSKLAICNDGGIMHVAGAIGCPVVAVMPNTPDSYRPPGNKTEILRSNLPCAIRCYPDRPKSCKKALCLENIKPDEVYRACIKSLRKFS